MKIRFWGVRGSLATPLTNAQLIAKIEIALKAAVKSGLNVESRIPEFIRCLPRHVMMTAGGDTSCVEVNIDDKVLILDAGSGFRRLGIDLLKRSKGNPIEAHIMLTHTHWDHICGIPFFAPAFNPANKLIFYCPHKAFEERLKRQQSPEYFPAPLYSVYQFVQLDEYSRFQVGAIDIQTIPLNHPGGSFGYRIAHNGKILVYATDSEYKDLSAEALRPYINFFKDADMLIYDAQYTMLENFEKEDWGHSNMFTGIDMALEANVKRLVFTHHDPTYDDNKLWEILKKANEYLDINRDESNIKVYLAFEGGWITL